MFCKVLKDGLVTLGKQGFVSFGLQGTVRATCELRRDEGRGRVAQMAMRDGHQIQLIQLGVIRVRDMLGVEQSVSDTGRGNEADEDELVKWGWEDLLERRKRRR